MPNILSNKKSLRKDQARRLARVIAKKKLKKLVKEGKISEVYKSLDSQVSKGLIHKNKSNRLKSRYATLLANSSTLEINK